MKKILMVLSLTLAAMVSNAQVKKFAIEHYVESARPNIEWLADGMKIEICPDYVKVYDGNISVYSIISKKKSKNDTIVYKVRSNNGNILVFRLLEREKFIEYIDKNATNDNSKRYYYDLQG
jgi:hypothetical protein